MRSSLSKPDFSLRCPLDPGRNGFAHRGLHSAILPENSYVAFRAAIDGGIGIECDVRLSGDGEVVIFHDHDLQRLCSLSVCVEETPAALLMGQRLMGTRETIPRLFDLLELVRGRVPLLIEVKTFSCNERRLVDAVLSDLVRYDGPIGVMSFDPRVTRHLKANAPDVARGLVISDKLSPLKRWWSIFMTRPSFLAVDVAALGKPWVARWRKRLPIYSWTSKTRDDARKVHDYADAAIWEADGRP